MGRSLRPPVLVNIRVVSKEYLRLSGGGLSALVAVPKEKILSLKVGQDNLTGQAQKYQQKGMESQVEGWGEACLVQSYWLWAWIS